MENEGVTLRMSSQVIWEVYIYAYVFVSNHFTPYFGYVLVFSAENHNALNRWSLTKKRPLVYGFFLVMK